MWAVFDSVVSATAFRDADDSALGFPCVEQGLSGGVPASVPTAHRALLIMAEDGVRSAVYLLDDEMRDGALLMGASVGGLPGDWNE